MADVTFTILIEKDEESGYVARVLELKGVYGQGETEDEAFNDIQKALDLALETYSLKNIPLPYRKVIQVTKNISTATTAA